MSNSNNGWEPHTCGDCAKFEVIGLYQCADCAARGEGRTHRLGYCGKWEHSLINAQDELPLELCIEEGWWNE